MKKKNKLIIFMPSIEGGGVEKNLILISNFLSTKFKNVILITSSKNTEKFKKNIKILNFSSFMNLINSRTIKIILSCLLLIFYLLKNKNTLVFSFQANLSSILIAKIFNAKIIVRLNSSPSGWIKSKFKEKIFKKIYSFADLIIVNSEEFKKELRIKLNVKSFCIFNPLDKKNIIQKSKKKINNIFFKKKNTLKIINVARLVDQKDHITLLKSINLLKNKIKIMLIIIGRGHNKSKIEEYIRINSLENNVKILDFKKNPYPFIKSSDVFILSSLYEGLPNVLLESIVLKRFVISSNCPTGPKEILSNGKGGFLFKTGSSKNLCKKIMKFYKNKNKNNKKKN